jgi:hypothetical protein
MARTEATLILQYLNDLKLGDAHAGHRTWASWDKILIVQQWTLPLPAGPLRARNLGQSFIWGAVHCFFAIWLFKPYPLAALLSVLTHGSICTPPYGFPHSIPSDSAARENLRQFNQIGGLNLRN